MVNILKISRPQFLLLTLAFMFAMSACYGEGETKFDYFRDFKDINNQGEQELLEYGWIPKLIPDSSTDINVERDFDSNQTWMRFKSATVAMQPVIASGREIAGSEKEDLSHYNPFDEVDWWFTNIDNVAVYKVENAQSKTSTYVAVSDDFYYLWVEGS